jgi:glycosyltransferase involved in cell wall biosynthesis
VIKDRVIVCIGNAWDDAPTSKHQVMRLLAQHNRIVWVNFRGTRRPTASRADLRAATVALRRIIQGPRRVAPTVLEITPLIVPGAKSRVLRALNRHLLITQIRRAVRDTAGADPANVQVWTFTPDVPYLRGALDEECFVYYCTDDFAGFQGVDEAAIRRDEAETLARADLVVVTSQELCEARLAQREDVALVRHGVDHDHFARSWRDPGPAPADMAASNGPVFGFFGLIHHWIDIAFLAEVARLRPAYTFALIGEAKVDVTPLARLANVRLLGRRPYAELPAYCTTFSAGLMPFTRTELTRNINPIKLQEYLAAGLPVISTPLPEAARFGPPVMIGDTPLAFAEACDSVARRRTPAEAAAISDLVKDCSWSAVVEKLSRLVMARVGRSRSAADVIARAADVDLPSAEAEPLPARAAEARR